MSADELLEGEPGQKKTPAQSRPTICAECYFYCRPQGSYPGLCANPMFAIPPQYDCETGRVLNQTKPNCRDINTGDCPGFSGGIGMIPALAVSVVLLVAVLAIVGAAVLVSSTGSNGEGRPRPELLPNLGDGGEFGPARFGHGSENVRGVAIKVGDPQFTLLWDTEVDLDLHVIEPGGKEIFWESRQGNKGGELDVDNTKGFGPENIYWLHTDEATGEKVKGQGPPGEYRWFVVYWGGFGGIPRPTRWKVRIKHAGQVTVVTGQFKSLNERSETYTMYVD
jgi:hypothetical protein